MSGDSAYAAAPFDHAKADIILRSSDNIDFRVFKLFLSLASPVFETLFEIPQPARMSEDQGIKDGLAVIPVTEDSKTLNTLLCFCYPCTLVDDPKLEVLQEALDIINAAKKYSLDAIEMKARQAIADPEILKAEPLRCFVIAYRAGLREETLLAAKYTLIQPLVPAWFQEIELIGTTDLLTLLTYHQECGEALYALRLDLSWITLHYRTANACSWLSGQIRYTDRYSHANHGDCGCASAGTSKYKLFNHRSLQWWEDFMEETFAELRDKPCKGTVQTIADETIWTVKGKNCPACSPRITEGMRDLVALFEEEIEEIVSRVKLKLKF